MLDRIARELYTQKMATGKIDNELYFQTADKIMTGVFEGMGGTGFSFDDKRNNLSAYLQQNIHAFSAAKSVYQLRHFANMMVREDGSIRDFTSFRNKVISAGYVFNVNHLQTEYNTALASAQVADIFARFKDDDWLQISTVGDSRVRPEHAALDGFTALKSDKIWRRLCPPFAFNCRCTLIPGLPRNAQKVLLNQEGDNWLEEKYQVSPYFQSNTAQTKVIFETDGPKVIYDYKTRPRELLAVDHYNLPPVETLLEQSGSQIIPGATQGGALRWWDSYSAKKGFADIQDITNITLRVPDRTIEHIINDHPGESRYKYLHVLPELIEAPDEIWSIRVKNKLERVYLKFFEGMPIALRVDKDLIPYTMHDLMKVDKETGELILNDIQAINLRKGALLYKKTNPF